MRTFSTLQVRAFLRRVSPLDWLAIGVVGADGVSHLLHWVVPFRGLVEFFSVVSIVYLLFRVLPWVRGKLLWSLRNRLIVAYVFIAVVPVFLLLSMGTLALYLLYAQLGAHLLQDGMQAEMRTLQTAAQNIAAVVDNETPTGAATDLNSILRRPAVATVIASAIRINPGLRAEISPSAALASQVKEAPRPENVGMVVSRGELWLRCIQTAKYGRQQIPLMLSAPINSETLDSLEGELGPIQLTVFRPLKGTAPGKSALAIEVDGQKYITAEEIASRRRSLGEKANWFDFPVGGGLAWEAVALEPTRLDSTHVRVLAAFTVLPSRLNGRLFAEVGAIGPLLTFLLGLAAVLFLILEAGALATGVVLTRRITSAVADLYDATHYVRRGDFSHRVRVQKRDQLGVLGESFNEMTSSISELIAEQAKRQRLENEISIAREVQAQLFPQSIPKAKGIELAAICRAARVVSGDYYDFIRLGPARVGLAVADISGKGISAALLMASLQAALRSQAMLDGAGGTAQVVARLNQHLFHNTSDDRYATFFYAVYDAISRTLEYTNAGHCAPILVTGDVVKKLDIGGTVVGLFDEAAYSSDTIEVRSDSLVVAFSDGLTEPENVYGEEFGNERLVAEVLRHRGAPLEKLAGNLIDAAEQWGGSPEQADDMTVVVARLEAGK